MTGILLQAAGGSPYSGYIMMGLVAVIFYLFFILPQVRKTKAQKKFKENIKVGDKIVTIGGIHGKIAEIADSTFIITVENGVKLKVEKNAISLDNTNLLGTAETAK
ncbi:MAG TPA: preprotein translocase subunit YajC [Bacteroidia bacterium]|jgi:preprotein translocase subunit YajC|nr:preprotein translocase subunit YajC [Bacteroidia bacterium]